MTIEENAVAMINKSRKEHFKNDKAWLQWCLDVTDAAKCGDWMEINKLALEIEEEE